MTTVKNVEAYSRLVGFCTGYGGKYNPGHQNLRVDALMANLSNAREAIERADLFKTLYDEAVNARKLEFASIGTRASYVVRALKNADAEQEVLSDARAFVRQLVGKRLSKRQTTADAQAVAEINSRSMLQTSYVSKANWFSRLVQLVEQQMLYNTYVEELSKENLRKKAKQLDSLNEKVIQAYVAWSNARLYRDKVLYSNANSLGATFAKVKDEVRMLFGSMSSEFAQVRSLKFNKM